MNVKNTILEQLRKFASVPGKQRTWISRLGDNQLYELFLQLKSGESAASIARHAQKAWKVSPRSSPHSVSQGILKFKQRIAHLLLLAPQSSPSAASTLDLPLELEEGVLETMENIAREYQGRITAMFAEEKQTGTKFPYLNRDLQALANLQRAILKIKESEAAHGSLRQRQIERMQQTMDRRFHNLMDSLGSDGQERLVQAANRFLELAEKKAVIMQRKEDGSYELVKSDESPEEA